MCGIFGKVSLTDEGQDYRQIARAMSDRLVHRGPDDSGIYCDRRAMLGHRRLAIIDLSTGKQPISNEDGTVTIVFNGEIYNYRTLREFLRGRGHRFATATDTEVIVHLYEEYGDECVSHLQGMFAFAIWDSLRRRLLLARDRVGIKPLYYLATSSQLLFASEMKALLVDPDCPRDVDPAAIDHFLTFHYGATSTTPLKNIRKLAPGHYLTAGNGSFTVRQYWDLEFPESPRRVSFGAAKVELLDLLNRTVQAHMISDVPVGILLSGGVDSSGVLSFAAQHAERPVHTFTIGFGSEQIVDERPYARLAAQRYGAHHHETSIGPQEFLDFLPKYVWHMEELVCEPPAIALYFVTKLARDHGIKVLLSGEGGDEAFAGYNTYRNQLRIERIRRLPAPWPRVMAALADKAAHMNPDPRIKHFANWLRIPLEKRYFSRTASPDSHFGQTRRNLYSDGFYAALQPSVPDDLSDLFAKVQSVSPLSKMLYVDTKTWLPDDLLIKADKITMANSVELRVPLLDHKVLEFAASLPDSYKAGRKMKHILREILRSRVPEKILGRKKAGFPLPVGRWLSGELSDFSHDLLTDSRTMNRGYLRRRVVESLLGEHRRSGNRSREIFSLLVLELWHRQFADVPVAVPAAAPA